MKKKFKFKITYNAPVTLSFAIACAFILLIDKTLLGGHFIPAFFTAPACSSAENGFNPSNVLHYIRLFIHVLGHSDWNHLLGNLSFILLLGPLLEERYGSKILCLMFLVTALVTGVINSCLLPNPLYGASGIVFMLIVLASITNIEKNVIPLSFIFVVALYLGREIITPKAQNISTIAHIAGGLCGSLFGFLVAPKEKLASKKSKPGDDENKRRIEEIDSQSPRFKAKSQTPKEVESEVIGTIEL